jgi:hypothetical protein
MDKENQKLYMMYYLGLSMGKGLFEKNGALVDETHKQVEKLLTTKEKEELDQFLTDQVAIKKFLDAPTIKIKLIKEN